MAQSGLAPGIASRRRAEACSQAHTGTSVHAWCPCRHKLKGGNARPCHVGDVRV